MGRIVSYKNPCLDPECGSSDARQIYEDGTSYCFSCRSFFKAEEGFDAEDFKPEKTVVQKSQKASLAEISAFVSRGFAERKIKKDICEFFKVKVSYDRDGEIDTHYYPYADGKAYKVRELPKKFYWVGNSSDLFGRERFSGGGKRLVITEGEIDALSFAQASMEKYKKIYPVVALSSATMAEKSLLEHRDWIRSFAEVVLCLDMDEAGQEATAAAIKIIGIDKVKIAKLSHKDPNEVLLKEGGQVLLNAMFDAAPYIPSGIITKEELWDALVNYRNTPSIHYPECLSGVNQKTKGARLGEIALFVSGTSCGKSTLMREIMLSMKEKTDARIGCVALEEAPAETAVKLSGMTLKKNPAAFELSLEELKPGFDEAFGSDRFTILDHQGSLKDESILDKLEYMALSGCKYIIIDHITILVSEGSGDLTGNEAQDKVMNDLLRFVKRHDVWIGLVSHLRKTPTTGKAFEEGRMPNLDDIKGSGSIKQIAFDIIAFARNLMEPNEVKRNTINIAVLKCRYTGLTGNAGAAYYDYPTGRFSQAASESEDFEMLV